MNEGGYFVAFLIGTLVGALTGYGIAKHRDAESLRDAENALQAKHDIQQKSEELDREAKIEYDKILHDYAPAEEEKKDDEPDDLLEDVEDPFVVDELDFQTQYPEYTDIRAIYFQRDGVMTDEDETETMPTNFLGDEVLWVLENTVDDVVYVICPATQMAYEIQVNHENVSSLNWTDDDEEELV